MDDSIRYIRVDRRGGRNDRVPGCDFAEDHKRSFYRAALNLPTYSMGAGNSPLIADSDAA